MRTPPPLSLLPIIVRFITLFFWYSGYRNQKGVQNMDVTIRYVRGHVEVYTREGSFLFSADTEGEALRELEAEYAA